MATRTRSPNYPAISLGEAVECARRIFAQEHFHRASDETIAQDLGYTGLNGRSIGIISALKKYGLLVPEEDGFRLSDDAQAILEFEPSNQERMEALNRAAFNPSLFRDLHEEFGEILPSEGNLRAFLIKRKFHPEKANDVIQIYRDTLELVTQSEQVYYNAKRQSESATKAQPAMQQPPPQTKDPHVGPNFQIFGAPGTGRSGSFEGVRSATELAFKLSKGSEAKIIIYGNATQEAIKKLRQLLELSEDTFPTEEDLQTLEDYAQERINLKPDSSEK